MTDLETDTKGCCGEGSKVPQGEVPACSACGQWEVWLWQSSACSQHPAAASPVLTKIPRGLGKGSALPFEGDLTQGVGSAGKQSKTRANRRKRRETVAGVFRNLLGETVAMNENLLALKDCNCPRAWSSYQVVAAGIAVAVPW